MLEEIVLQVGKHGIDDRRKIVMEGALVRPDSRHRDIGILFAPGLNVHWKHYIDYFSKQIGDRWPIYVTQLRRRGWAGGQTLVNDVMQIDAHIRDRLETDRLVYFGHSVGVPIAIRASMQHARQVLGYLGMATYPSYGDCFNANPYIRKINRKQQLVNAVGKKTNFGWLAFPLRDAKFSAPAHFVIANRDEVIYTCFRSVRRRFKNYFESIGSAEVIPGNHVFNQRLFKLRPYNKDNPIPLLQQAFYFVERLVGD